MTNGQPDFVFADEEDGVVAIKHGTDIVYASLYWRSRYAVNFLARVHYVQPETEHIAVVREEVQFEPSGLTYSRPDWDQAWALAAAACVIPASFTPHLPARHCRSRPSRKERSFDPAMKVRRQAEARSIRLSMVRI